MRNPFRYFNSSPEVIHLAVMMYIRYPLSLRQVEDILFERGTEICRGTFSKRGKLYVRDRPFQRLGFGILENPSGTENDKCPEKDARGNHKNGRPAIRPFLPRGL